MFQFLADIILIFKTLQCEKIEILETVHTDSNQQCCKIILVAISDLWLINEASARFATQYTNDSHENHGTSISAIESFYITDRHDGFCQSAR